MNATWVIPTEDDGNTISRTNTYSISNHNANGIEFYGNYMYISHGSASDPYGMIDVYRVDDLSTSGMNTPIRQYTYVNVTVVEVDLAIEVEDPKINNVRSGLNVGTLQIKLNGTAISNPSIQTTYETIDGEQVPVKLNISYTPTCSELVFPGTNTVTVDIDDRVNNHMEQVTDTFQLP